MKQFLFISFLLLSFACMAQNLTQQDVQRIVNQTLDARAGKANANSNGLLADPALPAAKLASEVFAGTTVPLKKGNILYNIINDNTGELVSYKEITKYATGRPVATNNADGVLVRKISGKYYMLTKDRLTTKDFGATGDGMTDDYPALQNAINVASRWGRTLYVPAGTYLHSQTLVLPATDLFAEPENPWFTLKMIGDGQQVSIFRFTGRNDTCFKVEGGAGRFGGGGLYDLAIDGGNQTNIGLYVSERGNFQTFNCAFNNLNVAVLLQNTHRGSFTESVVQNTPIFNNCHTFLEYKVTGAGTDGSFNGSGINGGYGNVAAADNYPIKVDKDALPYNAPLSLETWFYNNAANPLKTLIHNASGSSGVNFYGHLTIESFYYQGIHPASPHQLSDGSTVTFCGTVNSLMPLSAGRLRITNAFVLGGQGIRDITSPNPRSFNGVMHNGYFRPENNITENISANSTIMRLSLQCKGFKAEYLLLLTSKNDNHIENGSMIKLATMYYETNIGFKEPVIILDPHGYLEVRGFKQDGVAPYNVDVNIQANVLPLTQAFEQVVGDIY